MKFDLTTDAWIPIRNADGTSRLVSLIDLFAGAKKIADLDLRPHERVSVMRLLVCIAQGAGGIPDDDWEQFEESFAEKSVAYLRREDIARHFELFGDGPRFLQLPVTAENPVSASKLFPRLASGNNSTVLDHDGGELRSFGADALALALLTFQNFYPLYGAGYKGRGPCVDFNGLHTLLVGETLHQSIIFNCLDAPTLEGFSGEVGRPVWEQYPDSPNDSAAVVNATATYLGRLAPLHRSVRLCDDGTAFHLVKESLIYPPFDEYSREPSTTIVILGKGDKQAPRLLSARLDQAVWRQLHALTVLRREARSAASAPAVLESFRQNHSDHPCRIWTGALVADNAKILDVIESTFDMPEAIFAEGGRTTYEQGVGHAEYWKFQLHKAVVAYGKKMMRDKPSSRAATTHYWNALDQASGVLLKVIQNPELPDGKKPDGTGRQFGHGSTDPWSALVRESVREAYSFACPRRTPRHLEAYAAGLRALYHKPKAKKKAVAKKVAATS